MTGGFRAVVFISGCASLIFETLWFHQAGLGFGNSTWASSLVLSGFMAGLAIGNGLAARYGDRLSRPLRTYAVAEMFVALAGIGLVFLLPRLAPALAPVLRRLFDHPVLLNTVRLVTAFLLLLIPSVAMGVTLPVLTRTVFIRTGFGPALGSLYGWNTSGAVVGVIASEAYLVGLLGIRGTAVAAAVLSLMAAAGAFSISKQWQSTPSAPAASARRPETGIRWLTAAFASGFCLLVLEVVWFRLLLLFVMGDSMAFAFMLGIVLVGIALGGFIAAAWLRRFDRAHRFTADLALMSAVCCTVSYAAFARVIHPFEARLIASPFEIVLVGTSLMFPVALISGALFTFIGAALRGADGGAAATAGRLTLANTAGAAIGSLAGGFLFLPVLGVERSLAVIALLYIATGIWLLRNRREAGTIYRLTIAVGSLALFPFGTMDRQLIRAPARRYDEMRGPQSTARSSPARVVTTREGLTETIVYLEMSVFGRPLFHQLFTNATSMADTEYFSRRYMKLYAYWPIAVHPHVKQTLLICYGIGNTAKALTDSKSVESIDIVDISRDVLQMNAVVYPVAGTSPLSDPRVKVHIEDGRHFLQATDRTFDLITAEPPPPRTVGAVNLYTREYFTLLRDRLSEGGIVAYWLPLHAISDVSAKAILRAFCDVFDDCSLWNGMGAQLMMIGGRSLQGPVSENDFVRQWQDRSTALEMKRLGLEIPEQLGALFIGDAEYLKRLTTGLRPMIDDDPKLIEAPNGSRAEVEEFQRSLTDVVAARERFATSPLIERLWPARLRAAALSYFEVEGLINLYGKGGDIGIQDVHRVLTETRLTTPALWFLGSDWDTQQAVIDAPAPAPPAIQFHFGVRLIAERSYAAAAVVLQRAEADPQYRARAFAFRLYALCMAGQVEAARRIMAAESPAHPSSPLWSWIDRQFDL